MEAIKLMIGGQALRELGNDRHTEDIDYLVNDTTTTDSFIKDHKNNIDYINANGHPFFKEVAEMEKDNIGNIASPQALLELKAFSLVQHCRNFHFQKADAAEYDMKFIVRTFFNVTETKIVQKYVTEGEMSEINRIIKSVKR